MQDADALDQPKRAQPARPRRCSTKLPTRRRDLVPALAALGRRALGDGIYHSDPVISGKNEFDPKEISIFKNRSLSRHEKYNGLLKNFNVLREAFRHTATKM